MDAFGGDLHASPSASHPERTIAVDSALASLLHAPISCISILETTSVRDAAKVMTRVRKGVLVMGGREERTCWAS